MSREEVIHFLNDIESRYPVSQWKIRDIHIWPVLKKELFFSWFYSIHPSSGKVSSGVKKSRFEIYKRSFFLYLSFLLKKFPSTSFLFAGASSHRVTFMGKFYNRYFDPMIDYIEASEGSRPTLVEYGPWDSRSDVYRADRVFPLAQLFPIVSLFVRSRCSGQFKAAIHGSDQLDACLAEVSRTFKTFKVGPFKRRLVNTFLNIYSWSLIFDRLFKKVQPKYAFGLCYYNTAMYGMNVSAARNNVVSVDMQHGGQGIYHFSYGYFQLPSSGYSLLPDIFWCWEKSSGDVIASWTKNNDKHKVIVGGNPWLNELAKGNANLPADIFKRHKIILYTLQPLTPVLDDYILEAIRLTPPDYEWWLRLHPRQYSDKAQIIKRLQSAGVFDSVNIEDATELPLPLILMHTSVHISKYSGSILEASMTGVMNVIIDAIGEETYRDEVVSGRATVYLGHDARVLMQLVLSLNRVGAEKQQFLDFRKALVEYFAERKAL